MKHTNVNLYVIRQNYSTKGMLDYVTTLKQKEIKNINLLVNDIDEKVCITDMDMVMDMVTDTMMRIQKEKFLQKLFS